MKNILISTGGSGGHVVPAKILSEHLHSNFNVFISTDSRGLKYLDDEKNDIILTGAYGPPIPIKNNQLIEVTSSLFGNVRAVFK